LNETSYCRGAAPASFFLVMVESFLRAQPVSVKLGQPQTNETAGYHERH